MDSIMWDCDNRSYLELVKYFWVGNYKQCKYQKSVRLRLPVLNLCKFTWEFSLFLSRFVCRRCPSLWQYEAVRSAVAIFGPCILQCRPYRYWKETVLHHLESISLISRNHAWEGMFSWTILCWRRVCYFGPKIVQKIKKWTTIIYNHILLIKSYRLYQNKKFCQWQLYNIFRCADR